ncbi:MAG TPA: tRNA lysidine(34) synthetase TilS [Alphaproteobacteria bacterium]|nr:tRNA lysidine(34) synthetase TilS [Alphaproteobacteria bacterium]
MAVNNTAACASASSKEIPASIAALFADAMASLYLPSAPRMAVAVSGGADSLGLLFLLADWCAQNGGAIKAYTVNHNLRPEAKAEAEAVAAICRTAHIPHDILTWDFAVKPESHVQERARIARYDLLQAACHRDGFDYLATAHHLEDQIETFWMRLTHGSGIDGLAGMQPVRQLEQVTLIRPLLSMPRAYLRDVCQAQDVTWVEDPSNQNENFLRPRLRGFEDMLAAEGLTPQRLGQTLQKLAEARGLLQQMTDEAVQSCTVLSDMGYVVLNRATFATLPPALAQRVLMRVLSAVAPAVYPPGSDTVQRLYTAMVAQDFAGQTAYGCDVQTQGDHYLITREHAATAAAQPIVAGTVTRWDDRFDLPALPMGVQTESWTLGILGSEGVAALRKQLADAPEILTLFESLPGRVRAGLPVVRAGKNLLSVPHLSWIAADAPPEVQNLFLHFRGTMRAAKIV